MSDELQQHVTDELCKVLGDKPFLVIYVDLSKDETKTQGFSLLTNKMDREQAAFVLTQGLSQIHSAN